MPKDDDLEESQNEESTLGAEESRSLLSHVGEDVDNGDKDIDLNPDFDATASPPPAGPAPPPRLKKQSSLSSPTSEGLLRTPRTPRTPNRVRFDISEESE